MNKFLKIVLFGFLPSILIIIGKFQIFFKWLISQNILSENFNIDFAQLISIWIGIVWAGLATPIDKVILESKYKSHKKRYIGLVKYHKEIYFELIKKDLKQPNAKFNTRIFTPQKGFNGWWKKWLLNTTVLKLVNIEGISDPFYHKSLQFEINKNETQGLVGKCYRDDELCIDLDLSRNQYTLTKQQKSKIGAVEFCSAIPIYNMDQSKIIAILSVDSINKFNFNDEQKKYWEEHMKQYAAFVDKHTNLK